MDRVLEEDIPRLPKVVREMIEKAIETRLKTHSVAVGKPLKHGFSGFLSLRVSRYRLIYHVEGRVVVITAIDHRKDVY